MTIGYYESWAYERKCDSVIPEDIQPNLWTHLNYAFALIDPNSYTIGQMNAYDSILYPRFTALKMKNTKLKTYIAIGGWDAGGEVFSNMVATSERRRAFISSALIFCRTYAFDGIDIDWEYPAATDRGGRDDDFDNFVTFMSELSDAFDEAGLGVTATLPSSYWYMKGFDIVSLEPYVDWFNLMTYDIHGTWDGNNPYTSKVVNPHTNLTEIDDALNLLWRNGINPSKVVMGLGFYGRSFTLKDTSCTKPGCAFSGGGNPGECTDTAGILSNLEIQRIITEKDLEPIVDKTAAVKFMSWDSDQWVSYDDYDTFKLKKQYANSKCLGGTMVWAVDMDSRNSTSAGQLLGSGTGGTHYAAALFTEKKAQTDNQQQMGNAVAFWTPCLTDKDRRCPHSFTETGIVGHGKVYDFDLGKEVEGCHGSKNRVLCSRNGILLKNCHWYRNSKGGKICDQSCPKGTYLLTQNTHPAGDKSGCAHGTYVPMCCEGFETGGDTCDATALDMLFSGGLANNNALSNVFALGPAVGVGAIELSKRSESGLISVQSKKQKNKKSKRAGSNDSGGLYPCNGDYYDYPDPSAEFGYTPVYAYYLFDRDAAGPAKAQIAAQPVYVITETIRPASTITEIKPVTRICDGSKYPQPCAHYRSVASRNPLLASPICPNSAMPFLQYEMNRMVAPLLWNAQHQSDWYKYTSKRYPVPYQGSMTGPLTCDRDEWPPYAIWRGRSPYWIRFLPSGENRGVPNAAMSRWRFEEICDFPLSSSYRQTHLGSYFDGLVMTYTVRDVSTITTNALAMQYINLPVGGTDKDLLSTNPCIPSTLSPAVEPGFALYINDGYYAIDHRNLAPYSYANTPALYVTSGKTPPTRRWESGLDPDDYSVPSLIFNDEHGVVLVDDANTTRLATDEELAADPLMRRCADKSCSKEIAEFQTEYREAQYEADQVVSAILAGQNKYKPEVSSSSTRGIEMTHSERGKPTGTSAPVAAAAPKKARMMATPTIG